MIRQSFRRVASGLILGELVEQVKTLRRKNRISSTLGGAPKNILKISEGEADEFGFLVDYDKDANNLMADGIATRARVGWAISTAHLSRPLASATPYFRDCPHAVYHMFIRSVGYFGRPA